MNKRLLLTKVQLQNQFFATNSRRKTKISSLALTGLLLFGLSFYYSWMFLKGMDQGAEIMPYFMSYITAAMTFVFGITSSQGMLFGFKDYDILMSMPFTKDEIMTSKVVVFTILEYFYTWLFLLPAMIIFGIHMSAGPLYYIFACLGLISFPVLPMVLSSMIGILVQRFSAGKKYGELIRNLGTVAIFVVIYIVSFRAGFSSADGGGAMTGMAGKIGSWIPTAKYYAKAAVEENPLIFIITLAAGILLYWLFLKVYSGMILRINEQTQTGYHVKDFEIKKTGARSAFGALLAKEWKTFFGNFLYVFNTSSGMIICVGLCIYLFFKRTPVMAGITELLGQVPDFKIILYQGVILGLCFFGQMTCTTDVSISLEGKKLWLLKSMPLKTSKIFIAKIFVNLAIIIVPSMISLILLGLTFSFEAIYYILGIVMIFLTAMFISLLGLLINLIFPKFDYDREVVVIKQSLSAFLGMFIPMIISISFTVYFALHFEVSWIFWAILAFYAVADAALIIALSTYGIRRFSALFA